MGEGTNRLYEPGDYIFKEGDGGQEMFVLLEGAVELRKRTDRAETVLKTVREPNDFFGEMAIVDERPRSASAVAIEKTKLLVVNEEVFEGLVLNNGRFALRIIRALSGRIRGSNETISDLVQTVPRERLSRGMVDFAKKSGEPVYDGGVKVKVAEMREWLNSHIGAALDEVDSHVFRLAKDETVRWAASSAKTRDELVLPQAFMEAYDRRSP